MEGKGHVEDVLLVEIVLPRGWHEHH
jgi:hypothetical protein